VEQLSKEQLQHRGPSSTLYYTHVTVTVISVGILRCNQRYSACVTWSRCGKSQVQTNHEHLIFK